MAESNEGSREISRSNMFPRDLLQRFVSGEEDEEEIELNLGLSLGGRFGVDKSKKLVRSSSAVVTMPLFRDDHHSYRPFVETSLPATPTMRHMGLMRTTSLPAESEEEWRKRKEMQTLTRLAAKRRRTEKRRNGCGGNQNTESTEANNNTNPEETATTSRRRGRPSSGLPRWSATANKGVILRQHSSSIESQGGGGGGGGVGSSSSVSKLQIKSHQASSDEARSILPSTQHQEATTKPNNQLRRLSSVEMKIEPQGKGKNKMPCVFTKGDGPNGKRVDGILYGYGNGEEVKIMCVCHGDLLSPSDFIKHAGGSHVDHPLRHIVVNTSAPYNLL